MHLLHTPFTLSLCLIEYIPSTGQRGQRRRVMGVRPTFMDGDGGEEAEGNGHDISFCFLRHFKKAALFQNVGYLERDREREREFHAFGMT